MKSEDVFKRRLKPLASLAEQMGVALFAVGGSVRDGLLGSRVRDVDLLWSQKMLRNSLRFKNKQARWLLK